MGFEPLSRGPGGLLHILERSTSDPKQGAENLAGGKIMFHPRKKLIPFHSMETKNRGLERTSPEENASYIFRNPPDPGICPEPRSRGPSNPSPGRHLSTLPACWVWLRRLFFRRGHRGLLCRAGMSRSRGRGRPGGGREPMSRAAEIVLKIQNDVTTTHAYELHNSHRGGEFVR